MNAVTYASYWTVNAKNPLKVSSASAGTMHYYYKCGGAKR